MKVTPFDELMKQKPASVREAAESRYQELRQEMLIRELRESLKMTQEQMERKTGIRRANLSRLEKQADMQIGTLRKIVSALGGKMEIIARFQGATVKIALPSVR